MVRTSTTFAARSSVGPTDTTSPGPAISASPARNPAASSSSSPGVRIVTAIALPSTRISNGSSTATSSCSRLRDPAAKRSIAVSATCGSIVTGMGSGYS